MADGGMGGMEGTGGIIEGVEYTVLDTQAGDGAARSPQEPGAVNDRVANDQAAGKQASTPGATAVSEYARALQTYGANRADHMAALEVVVLGWLDAKRGRSGSERTWRTYADTLASFRAALSREGLDLDGSPTPVALVAQAWAGKNEEETAPAPTTYNQRLACVSSFYKYARKQGIMEHNPIERVERRNVQPYAGSRALTTEHVAKALASIDRTAPTGARDYALLLTYLQTGRRLSEVAALECRDLEQRPDGKIRVTFRRCKGGKVLHDTLTHPVSAAMLAYLYKAHGVHPDQMAGDTPVWVSLAERNGTRGGRLSKVSISRICKARLGTTRVHTLRSTMAQTMEKRGAPVSLIQQRLAHSSLATTGIYLASLRQDDNPYADEIVGTFGVE